MEKCLLNYEFEVYFHVIQNFSSIDVEKKFLIKEFFQNYSSVLSNQQKTKMKTYFIQLIQLLQDSDLIESSYQVILDGKIITTSQLTI